MKEAQYKKVVNLHVYPLKCSLITMVYTNNGRVENKKGSLNLYGVHITL